MTRSVRQKRVARRRAAGFLFFTLLCTLVLLVPALRRAHTTLAFPPGGPIRATMARCNQAFLQIAQAATAEGTLIPPGSDGVLIPNWREMVALCAVTGTPLDTLFPKMVRLIPEENTLFFPSADGSLPLSPLTPHQVQVGWQTAQEAAPALTARQRALLAQLLSPAWDAAWQDLVSGPLPLDPELEALVAPLPPSERRELVSAACTLVGRVGYFWGGKSTCVGWDTRWGVPALVTAAGGSDTGSVLPYGLDCSGLVSWAAATAWGDPAAADQVGQGVRAQYAACTPVDWHEVQPGDLLFFPDLSHVGIAAGTTATGQVQVIHCSHSLGGVVLTQDAYSAGFTLAGAPLLFS